MHALPNIAILWKTILDYDSENMSSHNVSVWKHYLAGWETSNTLAILICNTTKVKDLLIEQTWKNNLLNKELRGTPKIDFLPLFASPSANLHTRSRQPWEWSFPGPMKNLEELSIFTILTHEKLSQQSWRRANINNVSMANAAMVSKITAGLSVKKFRPPINPTFYLV